MWDGPPPRSPRGAGDSSRRPPAQQPRMRPSPPAGPSRKTADNPYRPYGADASSRMPAQWNPPRRTLGQAALTGHAPAASLPWENQDLAAEPRRHGFAIFHDGNAGHLWRGSVASALGETIVSAGSVMWLATQTGSPLVVMLAVMALGLPFLPGTMLFAPLEHVEHPGRLMRWSGWLRVALVLGLIALQFRFILPAVLAILLLLSLLGRLHDSLRIAAQRVCLGSGETEHAASELHIGLSVAAVAGPLFASALFILPGQNILGVALGAAIVFLLCSNSEGFLDTLPPHRRDYLLAVPEPVETGDPVEAPMGTSAYAAADFAGHEQPDDEADPEIRRERDLPEWFQETPRLPWQVMAELRAGLGLAGTARESTVALRALALLGLVGGGMSVLEVFFVQHAMSLSAYYLGALLAVEGCGLVLGALVAGVLPAGKPLAAVFAGLVLSGVALVLLVYLPVLPLVLGPVLVLGLATALAVQGAQRALMEGFAPVERRALAAAARVVPAGSSLFGALLLGVVYAGKGATPLLHKLPLPILTVSDLLLLLGLGLIVSPALLLGGGMLAARKKASAAEKNARDDHAADSGMIGAIGLADDRDDDYPDYADDRFSESGVYEPDDDDYDDRAGSRWDDEMDSRAYPLRARDRDDEWDDDWDDRPRGGRGGRGGGRSPRW